MHNAESVFARFSDAMLFPSYFGWNWAALSDCLRDLHWLPADRYLVAIENCELLLSNDPVGRSSLLGILAGATNEWANPLGKAGGIGVPFNVVLFGNWDVIGEIDSAFIDACRQS